jgi:hypothetical protein
LLCVNLRSWRASEQEEGGGAGEGKKFKYKVQHHFMAVSRSREKMVKKSEEKLSLLCLAEHYLLVLMVLAAANLGWQE